MEDVAFYTSRKDAVDYLNENQLKELDETIKEVDKGEVVSWRDFAREITELRIYLKSSPDLQVGVLN